MRKGCCEKDLAIGRAVEPERGLLPRQRLTRELSKYQCDAR